MHHVWNCRTQATTHKRLEKREREREQEWMGGTSFLTWETSRHKLHTQTHFLVKMCGVRLKGWHNKIKKQKIKEHWPLHCNFFTDPPYLTYACLLNKQLDALANARTLTLRQKNIIFYHIRLLTKYRQRFVQQNLRIQSEKKQQ